MLEQRAELDFASRWGWVVARGVVAILFGLLAFSQPRTFGLTLMLLFAAYAFVGGIASVIAAARGGRAGDPRWGSFLIDGLLAIGIGMLAVFWPGRTALAFLWAMGLWAIVSGGFELASAIRLRKIIPHEWALGLAGAASILFGALLFARPMIGALAVVFWIGCYSIIFGALMTTVGFRMRQFAHTHRRDELPSAGLHQPV
jgi:uncharacterized membrane protein HdeD (DUF308 family)